MNSHDTTSTLLLACLRRTPPEDLAVQLAGLAPAQWTELIELAVEQTVPSLLYHRLKSHGYETLLPSAAQQTLQKKYYGIALRNMRLYQELGKITEAFNQQAIASVVLKGAHLAATVYETIALRTMGDIDIMMHQADLPAAIQQIQALGYRPIEPLLAIEDYLDYRHHLPPFVHPNAVATVEIHWTITSSIRTYTISMDKLWLHRIPITVANVATHGFCPEHLLLHVCMHATYQHQLRQGVRFLCDIAEIVQRYGNALDWDAITQQAIAWKWQRGLFLALYATQKLLGAPIPASVLHSLNPTARVVADIPTLQAMLFPIDRTLTSDSSPNFLSLYTAPQLSARLRLIQQRLFLPRKLLAVIYNVAPQSPWLPFYYVVRIQDLLRRYCHKLWRMWRGDHTIITIAGQNDQLQYWLEQE